MATQTQDSATAVTPWSRTAVIAHLERGISSTDPRLRRDAFVAWLASDDSSIEAIERRAVADPSPLVQRAIARDFPKRLSSIFNHRLSPDSFALAWLATAGETISHVPEDADAIVLNALTGSESSEQELIQLIRTGEVPADSDFFKVITKIPSKSIGPALIKGLEFSDPEVRLSMALAAFELGEVEAGRILFQLFESADDPADAYDVVEAVVRGHVADAESWLRTGKKNSGHALSMHFQLGLVALGVEPIGSNFDVIKTGDRDTRSWAVECLGMRFENRPLPREMIAILEGSTRDEALQVRLASVKVLVLNMGIENAPYDRMLVEHDLDPVSLFLAGQWLSYHAQRTQKTLDVGREAGSR
jgi:hypothetical protein